MKFFSIIFLIFSVFNSKIVSQVETDDVNIEATEEETLLPVYDVHKDNKPIKQDESLQAGYDLHDILPSHVHSKILFTDPALHTVTELPTNTPIHVLLSIANQATSPSPILLEKIAASIRYPQDITFFIQNFTSKYLSHSSNLWNYKYPSDNPSDKFFHLSPGFRASFNYDNIRASEQLAGRPFTLVVTVVYRDFNMSQYEKTIFNQTVMFTELETGLDGQTFFLYLLMAGCIVLAVLLCQNFVTVWGRKKLNAVSSGHFSSGSSNATSKSFEMGTQQIEGVDLDWIPLETLNQYNKKKMDSISPKLHRRNNAPSTATHKK
ncbi:unnamed protein product [Gordionus sp. m RMFG-2023]|uniref:translocon-associated protein subunit alpha-like n=1 Tax=Gordionus sp. m RMFG-2023 TaxID=3053472 RepID=UPI0030DF6052